MNALSQVRGFLCHDNSSWNKLNLNVLWKECLSFGLHGRDAPSGSSTYVALAALISILSLTATSCHHPAAKLSPKTRNTRVCMTVSHCLSDSHTSSERSPRSDDHLNDSAALLFPLCSLLTAAASNTCFRRLSVPVCYLASAVSLLQGDSKDVIVSVH